MNPLHWKHIHLVAWAATIVIGALLGVAVGWLGSPFAHIQGGDPQTLFVAWLHYPVAYWPWALFGAVVGGLSFYAVDLLTGFN